MYVNSHGITLTSVTLVWVNQSQFLGNIAGRDLDVMEDSSQIVSMDGGAWTLDGGVNIFMNNTFDGNRASANGGAISYKYYCFKGAVMCCAVLCTHAVLHCAVLCKYAVLCLTGAVL